jgi:hypothetical protein
MCVYEKIYPRDGFYKDDIIWVSNVYQTVLKDAPYEFGQCENRKWTMELFSAMPSARLWYDRGWTLHLLQQCWILHLYI